MKISERGLQFIIGWEGSRNTPYDDGGPGVGNCTCGVGHLLAYRPCTADELAQTYTDAQVLELLREDVARFEAFVTQHATVPLNQNQFDALVDFCFNTGGGYQRVWDAVNSAGDVAGVLAVTAVTPEWARAALTRRRIAEGKLYGTPPVAEEDDEMKTANWWTGKPFGTGRYNIDLGKDFGPGAAYLMSVTLQAPGDVMYSHGDFTNAGEVRGRSATFVLIPGQFGTAVFDVVGYVTFERVAASVIK